MKRKLTLPEASSRWGAQMGRTNYLPLVRNAPIKLQMQRVPFVDQAYDRWGAYWGMPANLYCAWGEDQDEQIRVFIRGDSRLEAKRKVLELLPNARFYR